MDGRMICDFTSFSTVFQSYQDNERLIMKGCVQWSSVYGREDFASGGNRTRSARSVGQRLTHWIKEELTRICCTIHQWLEIYCKADLSYHGRACVKYLFNNWPMINKFITVSAELVHFQHINNNFQIIDVAMFLPDPASNLLSKEDQR